MIGVLYSMWDSNKQFCPSFASVAPDFSLLLLPSPHNQLPSISAARSSNGALNSVQEEKFPLSLEMVIVKQPSARHASKVSQKSLQAFKQFDGKLRISQMPERLHLHHQPQSAAQWHCKCCHSVPYLSLDHWTSNVQACKLKILYCTKA